MDVQLSHIDSETAPLGTGSAIKVTSAEIEATTNGGTISRQAPVVPLSFGLIYCDYCCSLYSGTSGTKTNIEKSPLHDITALFEGGLLDAGGAILAVCLATRSKTQEMENQPKELTDLVARCAGLKLVVEEHTNEAFDFKHTFVRIYTCKPGPDYINVQASY
jgi:hypothetical protein